MAEKSQPTGKTHNPVIGIRFEPEVKARLHTIAERTKIPAATLARKWVTERIERFEEIETKLDQAGEDILNAAIMQRKEELDMLQTG